MYLSLYDLPVAVTIKLSSDSRGPPEFILCYILESYV